MRKSRLIIALVLIPAAMACTSMGLTDPPELTLVNIQFRDSTLFESTIEATMRVLNPSPEPLKIEGASFKLSLDGHTVGRGVSQAQLSVDGLATNTFRMDFHINNASALFRLRQIIETKSTHYGIKGKLFSATSYGRRSIRIEKAGDLDLSKTADSLNPGGTPEPMLQ